MGKFNSKSFNGQAFGAYVKRIRNLNQNALAKSKALTTNEQAKAALSSQTGSIYCTVPYFGRISGATAQNNDGATDITASSLSTYEQGFVVASRMDGFVERNFSTNITGGVDFMDEVASQVADYKYDVRNVILLKVLKGIFAMSVSGSTPKAKAAKAFIDGHTYNIAHKVDCNVSGSSLNTAIQGAGGDNKNSFKLVVMHSQIATNLENIKLLSYMKYTDAEGIEQDLALATWNGRVVLIDDNMPTEAVTAEFVKATRTTEGALKIVANTATPVDGEIKLEEVTPVASDYVAAVGDYTVQLEDGTAYTSYVLGEGAIVLDEIGDAVPFEMSRDAAKNGGQDTLYIRDRYLIGVDGISAIKPSGVSVTNTDLETGASWEVINDGTAYIEHKAIPVARIISRG